MTRLVCAVESYIVSRITLRFGYFLILGLITWWKNQKFLIVEVLAGVT